jgi:4-hydroxy-tetrahydrodipicolinate reductase
MSTERLRLLVVGTGRMGRLIASLAAEQGCEVVASLDSSSNSGGAGITPVLCREVDVAMEFTRPESAATNLAALARCGVHTVIGTTGWTDEEAALRHLVSEQAIGVVAAANFSIGAQVLEAVSERAAALLLSGGGYGAFVHEQHHAAKRDAPSGTALVLRDAVVRGGWTGGIDVSSTRAGHIPGTHVVGFDGSAETITLSHVVRDRATFALGALVAAHFVARRRGWFTMRDVIGL